MSLSSGIGSGVSSYVNQKISNDPDVGIDWGTVIVDGIWGTVAGALSFGMADVGGATSKTLREIISQPGREILKQAGTDILTTFVITAGTWFNGTKMNAIRTPRPN